jgi:molybdopterin converting factor small subunit
MVGPRTFFVPTSVLVNGRPSETLQDTVLKDGDVVAFLSPIGGGSEAFLEIET